MITKFNGWWLCKIDGKMLCDEPKCKKVGEKHL